MIRPRWPSALVALVLATALVGWSGTVQRIGGQTVYNTECLAGGSRAACLEDQEVAGLPFAFLYDTPGVSVEHHVTLFEDKLNAWAFVLDVALVWTALFGLWMGMRRVSGRRASTDEPLPTVADRP